MEQALRDLERRVEEAESPEEVQALWQEFQEDQVATLRARGMSEEQIERVLGVTKNRADAEFRDQGGRGAFQPSLELESTPFLSTEPSRLLVRAPSDLAADATWTLGDSRIEPASVERLARGLLVTFEIESPAELPVERTLRVTGRRGDAAFTETIALTIVPPMQVEGAERFTLGAGGSVPLDLGAGRTRFVNSSNQRITLLEGVQATLEDGSQRSLRFEILEDDRVRIFNDEAQAIAITAVELLTISDHNRLPDEDVGELADPIESDAEPEEGGEEGEESGDAAERSESEDESAAEDGENSRSSDANDRENS